MLTYIGDKWIVDPDPIKVQPDWHICTHESKVSGTLLQWAWRDPYTGKGSKPIPFFQFTTRLGRHIRAAQTTRETDFCKGLAHISSSSHNYHQVLAENLETTTHEANYHVQVAINT